MAKLLVALVSATGCLAAVAYATSVPQRGADVAYATAARHPVALTSATEGLGVARLLWFLESNMPRHCVRAGELHPAPRAPTRWPVGCLLLLVRFNVSVAPWQASWLTPVSFIVSVPVG